MRTVSFREGTHVEKKWVKLDHFSKSRWICCLKKNGNHDLYVYLNWISDYPNKKRLFSFFLRPITSTKHIEPRMKLPIRHKLQSYCQQKTINKQRCWEFQWGLSDLVKHLDRLMSPVKSTVEDWIPRCVPFLFLCGRQTSPTYIDFDKLCVKSYQQRDLSECFKQHKKNSELFCFILLPLGRISKCILCPRKETLHFKRSTITRLGGAACIVGMTLRLRTGKFDHISLVGGFNPFEKY